MKILAITTALLLASCESDRIANCNESCNKMVQNCHGIDCKTLLDTCYAQCVRLWVTNKPQLQAEQDCSGVQKLRD